MRGGGREEELRWHFHPATSACRQFTYGGCGGNRNNFVTAGACRAACKTAPGALGASGKRAGEGVACLAAPAAGPCRGREVRYYWDAARAACDRFSYGGCAGNTNNFLTEQQCSAACRGAGAPAEEEEVRGEVGPCGLEVDPGPCTGNITR